MPPFFLPFLLLHPHDAAGKQHPALQLPSSSRGQSARGLIPALAGWAVLEVFMSLEFAGDYVWGGRILRPPRWDSQLWGLFPNFRAGTALLTLAPCFPRQENGGEPQSNSVSESPSSPGPLAVSPDSGETHSEVGLEMPGGGGGWKAGSGLSPHRGAVLGGMVGLTQPLAPQPNTQEEDKRHSASGSLLNLDIPLAVAKERAHQKRSSKRAPQMDWSKKNELFSNL